MTSHDNKEQQSEPLLLPIEQGPTNLFKALKALVNNGQEEVDYEETAKELAARPVRSVG